ncbi:YtxH domain-containing protein [Clostridium sp.]|uniref:YtxH domain-containing protein n=1 Tax=Clostridium sp. TaxID=1506 RepID=UPI0025C51513|nr:YtxH domain-containing protein [Clostridium sp.]
MGKVIKSLAIGTILGVTIGMMIVPELDKKTQRNIKRTSKRLRCAAGDVCDNILDYIN